MSDKKATIFDHLSFITDKKRPWDTLSDVDKKAFVPYLINRWLSMNWQFIEIVNELQKYTIGQLAPAEVYQLYYEFLPKQRQFNKYIKGKKDDKHNPDLIELIAHHFQISEKEAVEYIELYTIVSKDTLVSIIKKYGKSDQEVKKLLK
jgi:hypothetical protein